MDSRDKKFDRKLLDDIMLLNMVIEAKKIKGPALVPEKILVEGSAESETFSEVCVPLGDSRSGRNRIMILSGGGPGKGGMVNLPGNPDNKYRWPIKAGEEEEISRKVRPDGRYDGYELVIKVTGS